jgi:hypothetical protein
LVISTLIGNKNGLFFKDIKTQLARYFQGEKLQKEERESPVL